VPQAQDDRSTIISSVRFVMSLRDPAVVTSRRPPSGPIVVYFTAHETAHELDG